MSEPTPPPSFQAFAAAHPEIAEAHRALGAAVRKGPLSEREIALVKLAIAVGARSEGGVHAHARRGRAAGLEQEALEQVALLAITTLGFPNAMAAYSWIRDE